MSDNSSNTTGIMSAEPVYISAGCNRTPKVLDWGGKQNRLVYAQCHSVALVSQAEPFHILCTLNAHKDVVNSVKWITGYGFILNDKLSACEFVSASKDKNAIVWRGIDNKFEPVQILEGHKHSVSVLDAMYFDETNDGLGMLSTYIASASVDSTINIWGRHSANFDLESNKFNLDQTIACKMNGFALALKFYLLPLSKLPLLLIGYDTNKIEIHVRLHNETDHTDRFYCLHILSGHEDWIRDIDVCQPAGDRLLIASSSQDNYIRLWKLDSTVLEKKDQVSTKLFVEENITDNKNEIVIGEENEKTNKSDDEEEEDEELHLKKAELLEEELKLKSSLFTIHSRKLDKYVQYSMNLESVLYGHEDWIYTVKFHPRMTHGQPLTFISASMDKTLVVWSYNEENSVWIDVARAGEIGGNSLGLYGACFDNTGKFVVAHGYQGALHLWKRNDNQTNSDSKNLNGMNETLTPAIINSGHFDQVEDLCWEPEQQYLLSVSKDQTSRLHGCWRNKEVKSWHELGRPQIHGYDLKCAAFINRYKFVSGADEKLLRIFESPRIFLENYYRLSLDEIVADHLKNDLSVMPTGASVPALGLSNKAVFEEEKAKKDSVESDKRPNLADELYKEVYFNAVDLTKPPNEEHLLQNTLWPEIQKLYGHGFELFTVAVDQTSKVIASACKASKPEHAVIILWQEQLTNGQKLYKQYATLSGHELTIVQMKFSYSGKYLLSVSRDRSWKLFARKLQQLEPNNNELSSSLPPKFELIRAIQSKNSYHTRIIWSCDWSHNDKFFVTTSRDKRACVWAAEDTEAKPVGAFLELSDSITACAFASEFTSDQKSYLIAFGLENGKIEFYKWNADEGFVRHGAVTDTYSHHLTVKRLCFRRNSDKKTFVFELASCSDDNSVRLFRIKA